MSLNFYMATKNKELATQTFKSYELSEYLAPYLGYEIHIAKISAGWKPLFQINGELNSVAKLKALYETGEVAIFDEYGEIYSWKEFDETVLQHDPNGLDHYCGTDLEGYEFIKEDFV